MMRRYLRIRCKSGIIIRVRGYIVTYGMIFIDIDRGLNSCPWFRIKINVDVWSYHGPNFIRELFMTNSYLLSVYSLTKRTVRYLTWYRISTGFLMSDFTPSIRRCQIGQYRGWVSLDSILTFSIQWSSRSGTFSSL